MPEKPFRFRAVLPACLEAKPASIIEIGSNMGGSALWLADMLRSFGLPGSVVSIDLVRSSHFQSENHFIQGDANKLSESLTKTLAAELPRPWLVIEGSVTDTDCLMYLKFFDHLMQPGEFVVIEDGIWTFRPDDHLCRRSESRHPRILGVQPGPVCDVLDFVISTVTTSLGTPMDTLQGLGRRKALRHLPALIIASRRCDRISDRSALLKASPLTRSRVGHTPDTTNQGHVRQNGSIP